MVAFALAVALAAVPAAPPAPAEPARHELPVGQSKVLELGAVTRLAVGDPDVADVKVLEGGQVLLTARAEGRTSLLVWRGPTPEPHEIVVRKGDRAALLRRAIEVVTGEPLEVAELGDGRLVVHGTVRSAEAHRRLERLLDGEDVARLVELAPGARDEVLAQVNAALAREGFPDARAELVGSTLVLRGTVATEEDRLRAERIARAAYGF